MSKIITIIGSEGIVGSAIKFGFELLGHDVRCHDLKLNSKLEKVINNPKLKKQFCFICVPTPKNQDDTCNTKIVEKTVAELVDLKYKGIIIIKSTVSIGTTDRLINKYKNYRIANNCEFLTEKAALIDFTERQDLCVIGTYNKKIYKEIKKIHGYLPKKCIHMTPSEVEAVKYMNNSLGACLVSFANAFHDVCEKYGVNYTNVKNALSFRDFVPKKYLSVNANWRGWAGPCWSKDLPSLEKMCKGTKVEFFKYLIAENEKYTKTVPPGMREK